MYRIELQQGEMALLTGRPLSGTQAAQIELINEAVPSIASRPGWLRSPTSSPESCWSQLRAQKLIVNQAYENMGLASTQPLGGILDGLMRN